MDKIVVYVDDAAYALQQLAPMLGANAPTGWIVVACAPRITRRISKWVSHSARENWRAKWSEKLFGQITPTLTARGDTVTPVLAQGPLVELSARLLREHGAVRVLDARRPKLGQDLPPVTANQPEGKDGRWTLPGAVAGLGVMLVLAGE